MAVKAEGVTWVPTAVCLFAFLRHHFERWKPVWDRRSFSSRNTWLLCTAFFLHGKNTSQFLTFCLQSGYPSLTKAEVSICLYSHSSSLILWQCQYTMLKPQGYKQDYPSFPRLPCRPCSTFSIALKFDIFMEYFFPCISLQPLREGELPKAPWRWWFHLCCWSGQLLGTEGNQGSTLNSEKQSVAVPKRPEFLQEEAQHFFKKSHLFQAGSLRAWVCLGSSFLQVRVFWMPAQHCAWCKK